MYKNPMKRHSYFIPAANRIVSAIAGSTQGCQIDDAASAEFNVPQAWEQANTAIFVWHIVIITDTQSKP